MPEIVLSDRAEWLAERRNGLGASDISAALGINPWKTPFALWAEKCGLLPPEEQAKENEAIEWGLRLEEPIIEAFGQRTNRSVHIPAQPTMVAHPEYDFLRCTPDAYQWRSESGPKGDLQVKTTAQQNAWEWENGGVPLMYEVQVQAELFVTGMEWGSIACLIGGQRLVWRDIQPDTDFIQLVLPRLEQFWESVQTLTPPSVDGDTVTTKVLQRLHPDDNGATVDLPAESADWHEQLLALKANIKAAEQRQREIENQIRACMGSATFGVLPNGVKYSLKTQERSEYVAKASKYRVLRNTKG